MQSQVYGAVSICNARVCVCCFVSSRSGIVLNPSAYVITDHNQSEKDIGLYLSPSSVEDPGHRMPVLILPNGLSEPGERAHDINLISDSNPQPLDRQSIVLPLSYRRCFFKAVTQTIECFLEQMKSKCSWPMDEAIFCLGLY